MDLVHNLFDLCFLPDFAGHFVVQRPDNAGHAGNLLDVGEAHRVIALAIPTPTHFHRHIFSSNFDTLFPLFHGLFQRHALGNSLLALGVDGLDFLHFRAGQAVALHGLQRCGSGNHGNHAEHDDNCHLDARGIWSAVGGQIMQSSAQQEDEGHQGLGQGGHQLINQRYLISFILKSPFSILRFPIVYSTLFLLHF